LTTKRQVIREVKIKPLAQDEYRFHRLYLTPVIKDESIVRWVGVLTDIHEQKAASQVLENKVQERTQELKTINRQLEARNLELQRFAYIASHDLQEPLRKIQIFSDLVQKKFANDRESAEKLIQKIINSAERMRMLIRSLLAYSNLPDQAVYEVSDINSIVQEVIQDLELEIREQGAQLQLSAIPELEVIPVQMRQVFHNLISNALKFSKEDVNPRISIEAELVQTKAVDAEPVAHGKFCRILVRDNGIGFDQVYADKIFEIFQRLKQRDGDTGAGIGLAIVKKIIDRHDGVISVAAGEGEGTTFTVVLPVKRISTKTH
jgi:light-regulated signal transduction histidine kinase (bacteriophytochrome)